MSLHRFLTAMVLSLTAACLFTGCPSSSPPMLDDTPTTLVQTGKRSFELAIDRLRRYDELSEEKSRQQVIYQLNRWIEDAEPDAGEWSPALVSTIPRNLRQVPELDTLDQLEFELYDADFLREVLWMRQVSEWVCDPSMPETDLIAWIDSQRESLGDSAADELAIATRLFDWTVRNIQLDKLLDPPRQEAGASLSPAKAASSAPPRTVKPAPARGVPGPGYQHYPRQSLYYGHGDAWERARVFIHLSRQMAIPVVMIAIDDGGTPLPWVAAALIEDQLFLFDPALGLPLPGADGEGIATFRQVLDDPKLLENLDIGSELKYPVRPDDLKRPFALIDASYGYLSRRMAMLEAELTGANRMVLSAPVASVAERLRESGFFQEDRVRLWAVPYQTLLYRQAWEEMSDRERSQSEDPNVRQELLEVDLFARAAALADGRARHLEGQFDEEHGQPGAKAHYLQARPSNETIESVMTSRNVQREIGLAPTPRERRDPRLFQMRLKMIQVSMGMQKIYATTWLGNIQYDTGNYSSAVNWFARDLSSELQEMLPVRDFQAGADYGRARALESSGQYEQARQLYLEIVSPQRHGNLLRARRLQTLIDAQKSEGG